MKGQRACDDLRESVLAYMEGPRPKGIAFKQRRGMVGASQLLVRVWESFPYMQVKQGSKCPDANVLIHTYGMNSVSLKVERPFNGKVSYILGVLEGALDQKYKN